MRLPTEEIATICDVCPDTDSDALLIADYTSRCVKAIAESGLAELVYECPFDTEPRAMQLLRPMAGGSTALLLVEWLEEEDEEELAHYALVFAARSGRSFNETRRLPLPALVKEDREAAVSMATTSSGLVLIGNHKVKAL